MIFSAFVGAVSGFYIFNEPLKQFWAEEARRQQEELAAGRGSAGTNAGIAAQRQAESSPSGKSKQ